MPADQPTIAAGMSAAQGGDTVLLACGDYEEGDIVFRSGVTLRGENPDEPCVRIHGGATLRTLDLRDCDASTRIVGVELRGGTTGLRIVSSSPMVRNCAFRSISGGFEGTTGRAIDISRGSWVTIDGCSFERNVASYHEFGNAAGIFVTGSSLDILQCRFSENFAAGTGAALYVSASRVSIERTVFLRNRVGLNYSGGTIYVDSSSLDIRGSLFLDNVDGIACGHGAGVRIARSTFWSTDLAAIRVYLYPGEYASVEVENALLAGGDRILTEVPDSFEISCTDIEAGWGDVSVFEGVAGNFSADPKLCDPGGDAFGLAADSPCLPRHHPHGAECGLIGALDQGCPAPTRPMSLEAESWGRIKVRYR